MPIEVYEHCRDRFYYDADNGAIYRRSDHRVMGTTTKVGYIEISVMGRKVMAHRVAWFIQFAEVPEHVI